MERAATHDAHRSFSIQQDMTIERLRVGCRNMQESGAKGKRSVISPYALR